MEPPDGGAWVRADHLIIINITLATCFTLVLPGLVGHVRLFPCQWNHLRNHQHIWNPLRRAEEGDGGQRGGGRVCQVFLGRLPHDRHHVLPLLPGRHPQRQDRLESNCGSWVLSCHNWDGALCSCGLQTGTLASFGYCEQ